MDSEESFARLVNSANPAANNRSVNYPPTSNAIDPFFDDDDDGDLLDSAPPHHNLIFPTRSQESGLPLAHAAAPPAGLGPSTVSLTHPGQPQGWSEAAFRGSASFPGVPSKPHLNAPRPRRRKKWKWPWQKEVVLTGERVIALNNPLMNDNFCDNFVSTSKYNTATFLPKFLKGNSLQHHTHLETHIRPQSNSPNMPIYSSSSPLAFSRYQMYPLQISTPPSRHSQSSSSLPLSRKSKKTLSVPFLLPPDSPSFPSRNDTDPTRNSTPALPRHSRNLLPLNHESGKTSVLETLSASSPTSSSLPISYSSPHLNQRVSASSKLPTSTGKSCSVLHVLRFTPSQRNQSQNQASIPFYRPAYLSFPRCISPWLPPIRTTQQFPVHL